MSKVSTGTETDMEEGDQKEVDSPFSKKYSSWNQFTAVHSDYQLVINNKKKDKDTSSPVTLGVWGQYHVTIDDPSSTVGAPTISSRWIEILAEALQH